MKVHNRNKQMGRGQKKPQIPQKEKVKRGGCPPPPQSPNKADSIQDVISQSSFEDPQQLEKSIGFGQPIMVEKKEPQIELHMGNNKVKKLTKNSKIYIGILDTIKRADTV